MSDLLHVNEENFDNEVIRSSVPVVVDFWAEWCPPCRMIAPLLEQLSNEYSNRVKIVKLNVDNNPELASRYNITNIPTLLFFINGTPQEKIVGAVPKQKIKEVLDTMLGA